MSEVKVTEVYNDVNKEDKENGILRTNTKATIKDDDGNIIEVKTSSHVVNYGKDFDAAVKKFGKQAVYDMYLKAATVDFQNTARRLMTLGRDDELPNLVNEWKPGQGTKGDAIANAKSALAKMSPEEQKSTTAELLRAQGVPEAKIKQLLNI